MTLYRFIVIGPNGQKRAGQLEASGLQQARYLLSSNGDLILSLEEASKRNWLRLEPRPTISTQTAADFALEMAGLLSAGASLRKALQIQTDGDGAVSKLASAVCRDVDAGRSLSAALKSAGGAGETLAEFAAAGEAGAGLIELMAGAGRFMSARNNAITKIRSALAYPLFIFSLAIIALSVITLYVAPALAPAIADTNDQGLISQLASISAFLRANSTLILVGLACMVAGGFFLFSAIFGPLGFGGRLRKPTVSNDIPVTQIHQEERAK